MKLHALTLKDKKVFDEFLSREEHELSVYAFENIYIWRGLFQIHWGIIEGCLCVFFKDDFGAFLYLKPLGENKSNGLIEKVFQVMDKANKNKEVSRIENIEAKDTPFFESAGYNCVPKSHDYICLRKGLVSLSGNKFKSQRASFNFFTKNYDFEYLPLELQYKNQLLKLYDYWMISRKGANTDRIYQGMMDDSRNSLNNALKHYTQLRFKGGLVRVNKEIKAFTFGFQLNKETFCILYEITDLSIKGLAQFIFKRFCSELKDYKYINIMDDSGLENLKKVKLSYHPIKLTPAYIITRKHG